MQIIRRTRLRGRAASPFPQRSPPPAIAARTRAGATAGVPGAASDAADLTMRAATPSDLPWMIGWSNELNLPAVRSRRIRSWVLYKGNQRVGFGATQLKTVPGPQGPEQIVWIVSVFIIPSMRRQGLIPRFAELATRQYYGVGRFGARVARQNHRMRSFMEETGWQKVRETGQWVDYTYTLTGPWTRDPSRGRATRR